MYPILFAWGSFVLPAWHATFALGAVCAYLLMLRLARLHEPDLPEGMLGQLFVCAYLGGYFGARLLSVFIDQPDVHGFLPSLEALFSLGPMTFYGGAIGAFFLGSLYIWYRRLPLGPLVDITIPAGLVGLMCGRIGCFLNGDDFGAPVPIGPGRVPPWWSVTFPNLGDHVARYPVQLVEAGFAGLVALGLALLFKPLRQRLGSGSVGAVGIGLYAIFRFVIEYFRGDERGWVLVPTLSTSQFISVLVLLTLGTWWIIGGRKAARVARRRA